MGRNKAPAALIAFTLDAGDEAPYYRQLYNQIREAVLSGRLAAGARLPSSRALAEELGCSRNTVLSAFEQLLSEGYLTSRVGAGTRVSSVLPDRLLSVGRRPAKAPSKSRASGRGLSRRGRTLAALQRGAGAGPEPGPVPFTTGLPDISLFPFDVWGRILGRIWRRPPGDLFGPAAAAGYLPLRQAIVDHLRTLRGLACDPAQVIITSGGQQALDLIARILLDPGDSVWIEDPGYLGLRGALIAAGAKLIPVRVDGEGLSLRDGLRRAPDARMAVVTPSHQYPLGITLSLARRLALLDWAQAENAWVIEDDYDSEYRYAGRPLTALQGLDAARPEPGRVVYVGTFSKVLFPSLRLGYLVVPPELAEAVVRARAGLDDQPSAIAQPALAQFMAEGFFAAHIRRMRKTYAARQQVLLAAAARHLEGLLVLKPDQAGLHLVARFGPDLAGRITDREAQGRAAQRGLAVSPLSAYMMSESRARQPASQGLMLGYAAVPEAAIEPAVARLALALRDAVKGKGGR